MYSDWISFGVFFILMVFSIVTVLALHFALRFLLLNITARGLVAGNVMLALWHGVRVASGLITHLSTGDDSYIVEPVEWGGDLATIATLGMASKDVAASSGISSG